MYIEYQVFKLAGVYFEGKEVKINYQHAFELYNYCLEDICIENNRNVIEKYDVLISIIKEEDSTYFGNPDYQQCVLIARRIGWMLYTGNGVEKDETIGIELLNAVKEIKIEEQCPF